MGYDVDTTETDAIVTFTSKTRVGLNEEIDRFVKEKKPKRLTMHYPEWWEGNRELGELTPEYWHDGDEDDLQWYLEMYAEGMVHD